ncbi:hypothetical protein [Streptomyces hyaluromycini]|uniref:hypothetical protein n=1 Tax=Streptomyces hyaluromycini TaxID=1377993 RepID=UPI000B5CEB8C|nr:hypothetical protein [Streptomyces hyaluromycini]
MTSTEVKITTRPSRRTGVLLALAYLAAVFGLDYLSVERGLDAATAAVTVITFPSGVVTTILFLLGAVVFGYDDYSPGPDTYAPSVHAVAGIVQVVLVRLVLRLLRKRQENNRKNTHRGLVSTGLRRVGRP